MKPGGPVYPHQKDYAFAALITIGAGGSSERPDADRLLLGPNPCGTRSRFRREWLDRRLGDFHLSARCGLGSGLPCRAPGRRLVLTLSVVLAARIIAAYRAP